jgi:hypothetical protein
VFTSDDDSDSDDSVERDLQRLKEVDAMMRRNRYAKDKDAPKSTSAAANDADEAEEVDDIDDLLDEIGEDIDHGLSGGEEESAGPSPPYKGGAPVSITQPHSYCLAVATIHKHTRTHSLITHSTDTLAFSPSRRVLNLFHFQTCQ